ncbi:MAG: ABC transporter substrate-binding protein [Vagococcus sp.]
MGKRKTYLLSLLALSFIFILGACGQQTKSDTKKENELKKVTLILDYLPNTNHTGIYVAKEKGYYKEKGIDLEIIEPGQDNTSITLLGGGKGEFALSYQEDLTYAGASAEPIPVKAIAAVIEHNTSGFVSLASEQIKTPKDFEGKVYAGWQSASEEAVLKAVMKNAGADFSKLTMVGNAGAGAADLGKNVDLKWFFEAWDSTKAEMDGYDLNFMALRDLDKRLDFYTPVVIARDDVIEKDPELVQDFIDATKKGYQFAMKEPKESAKILFDATPDNDLAFLEKSQEFLSKHYTADATKWGVMKKDVWDNYTDFMLENQLIDKNVDSNNLFTNQFIEKDD